MTRIITFFLNVYLKGTQTAKPVILEGFLPSKLVINIEDTHMFLSPTTYIIIFPRLAVHLFPLCAVVDSSLIESHV